MYAESKFNTDLYMYVTSKFNPELFYYLLLVFEDDLLTEVDSKVSSASAGGVVMSVRSPSSSQASLVSLAYSSKVFDRGRATPGLDLK